MSNITVEDGSFSSGNAGEAEVQLPELLNHLFGANNSLLSTASANNDSLSGSTHDERPQQQAPQAKKKRSLPGNPELNADPSAEGIAPSPETLMATKPFTCEIRKMGFKKYQNLQLHRRGHNLPWKLEPAYVHHNPKL
ncbi:hypothetical protein NL676_030816 [Syzygium grande]|nr:hypothetical protein NL676_030816 [Syzygium grande]